MMTRDFFKGLQLNPSESVSEISNSKKEKLRNKKRIILVEMINNLNEDKKFRKINTNKESKDYIKSQIEVLNKQLNKFCGELHLSSCEFDPRNGMRRDLVNIKLIDQSNSFLRNYMRMTLRT